MTSLINLSVLAKKQAMADKINRDDAVFGQSSSTRIAIFNTVALKDNGRQMELISYLETQVKGDYPHYRGASLRCPVEGVVEGNNAGAG